MQRDKEQSLIAIRSVRKRRSIKGPLTTRKKTNGIVGKMRGLIRRIQRTFFYGAVDDPPKKFAFQEKRCVHRYLQEQRLPNFRVGKRGGGATIPCGKSDIGLRDRGTAQAYKKAGGKREEN